MNTKFHVPAQGPKYSLVVVSAGTSEQSSTSRLVSQILTETKARFEARSVAVSAHLIELRDLAKDIATALATGITSNDLLSALEKIEKADALIVGTPVYKASYSGLFKGFFDVVDEGALIGMPIVLAATAGTPRHALVPDASMRPLFAYFRSLVVPTSVFAATEDWANPKGLRERAGRAAVELVAAVESGFRHEVTEANKNTYRTNFSAKISSDKDVAAGLDFDSDLMRLAAGGAARRGGSN